jgi:CheY-like chemotaxis protein
MRILIVEDKQRRVDWFRKKYGPEGEGHEIHVTDDPDRAIELLQHLHPFDRLYLDHDLNREPKVGRDVSTWLIAHPENNPDLEIITHTVNIVSGPKIERECRAAGRNCTWSMFTAWPGIPKNTEEVPAVGNENDL